MPACRPQPRSSAAPSTAPARLGRRRSSRKSRTTTRMYACLVPATRTASPRIDRSGDRMRRHNRSPCGSRHRNLCLLVACRPHHACTRFSRRRRATFPLARQRRHTGRTQARRNAEKRGARLCEQARTTAAPLSRPFASLTRQSAMRRAHTVSSVMTVVSRAGVIAGVA